ncbi:hypothetical protein AQ915_20750 [Burkholderia pseudomallei]|nr:hypothetical protein AQ915_20750 [Burkholderia pseudomallei]
MLGEIDAAEQHVDEEAARDEAHAIRSLGRLARTVAGTAGMSKDTVCRPFTDDEGTKVAHMRRVDRRAVALALYLDVTLGDMEHTV